MSGPGPQCRDCRQPIVWATNSATGSSVPLDPSPDPGLGTLRRWHGQDDRGRPRAYVQRLGGVELHAAVANGQLLWIDHRQSCNARRPHNPKPAHIHAPTPRRSIVRRLR